jgi:hypothetical protein
MKVDMRSIYRFTPFDFEGALPAAGDVYYECSCGGIVNSVSFIKSACECGNITAGGGTATVTDPAKVKPLRGKLR